MIAQSMIGDDARDARQLIRPSKERYDRAILEAVYTMAFGTFDEAAERLPGFFDDIYHLRRLSSALGYLSPAWFEEWLAQGQFGSLTLSGPSDPLKSIETVEEALPRRSVLRIRRAA
ncbi:MAG: hypothetical protein NVS3B5_00490 [Sphingomicrobium sp.]